MTPGSPLVKQVTQSPPADLSDATVGDITAPRVEIGTHKNTQQTIETHAQTSLETQPESERISDQPRQTSDSTHLNKKVEEMEQQDINYIQVREESITRVKTGPKSTPSTPPNISRSRSAVEEEWGVMETETYKLKQDEQNVDSQKQRK
jgi:hypothetical protein